MFSYRLLNVSMIPQNEKPSHFLLIGVFFQRCIFGLWDLVLFFCFLVICWMLVCGGFDLLGLVCDWWHFVFAFVFVLTFGYENPLVAIECISCRLSIEIFSVSGLFSLLAICFDMLFLYVSLFGVYVLMIDVSCFITMITKRLLTCCNCGMGFSTMYVLCLFVPGWFKLTLILVVIPAIGKVKFWSSCCLTFTKLWENVTYAASISAVILLLGLQNYSVVASIWKLWGSTLKICATEMYQGFVDYPSFWNYWSMLKRATDHKQI